MSQREPMAPVEGLKKPALPPPTPRPRTLKAAPSPPNPNQSAEPGPSPKSNSKRSGLPATATRAAPANRPSSGSNSLSTHGGGVSERPRASTTAETMRSVSVSVPVSLAEAWRERAKCERVSQVDVLLDAIVANHERLAEVVEAARAPVGASVSDGLFERRRSSMGERFVGVSLRMRSGNLEVIDDLAEDHGNGKRSPFVAAVLKTYLR